MTTRLSMALVAAGLAALALGLEARGQGAALAAGDAPASREAAAELACVPDGRGFRELLETVRARALELDRREAELRTRERGLAAAEKTVRAEIGRLEAVAKNLGVGASGVSMAKVYESMSPADAAPILERLDDATLRAVLGRMRERQLAAILASMSRDRAVAATRAFAGAAGPAR